jgi:hypothetical protein
MVECARLASLAVSAYLPIGIRRVTLNRRLDLVTRHRYFTDRLTNR